MVFSSAEFIWFYLPIVIILYFIVNSFEKNGNKIKNLLLLVCSILFYAWGEPKYILLLLLSVGVNYIIGICIEKWNTKLLIIIGICFNLILLGVFKYFRFFVDNLNAVFKSNYFSNVEIILPIGISFYTFQALSYIIDVYRGKIKAQKNPVNLALYIAFFPQLIAGPIVKYKDIEKQLNVREITVSKFSVGVKRFVVGLGKKL